MKSFNFLLAVILSFSRFVFGATYYVANDGNDSSMDATDINTPWKTIGRVYTFGLDGFSAGDRILLKRGDIWREKLNVPHSGSLRNRISFGAYGEGEKPIISGADKIADEDWAFSEAGEATPVASYVAPWSGQRKDYGYSILYDDDVGKGFAKEDACDVLLNGDWYIDEANDIFQFKATKIQRPTALTESTAPLDKSWGIAIAYGTAVLMKSEDDDEELLARLVAAKEDFLTLLHRPQLIQMKNQRASPRF